MNGRRLLVGASVMGLALMALVPLTTSAATTPPSSAFSATETITRDNLINGQNQIVDTRNFGLTVSQTTQLRDRQEITVSWTGAHPTGGTIGDTQSTYAAGQEYPVVLMECRGVDSPSAPVADQISPETCFTETPTERSQSDDENPFPPYRIDQYATTADRMPAVGLPNPLPAACSFADTGIQHWVPFVSVTGTVYYGGGILGCAGIPPEGNVTSNPLQPADTTYATTGTDGTGTDKFVVATNETNASLGCSDTVPCSLVVIPIMGISCDATAAGQPPINVPTPAEATYAESVCSETGAFLPGQQASSPDEEDLTVSGYLWWSASNWRNRISVPLTFAPPSNICDIVNNSAPAYVYGSELMTEATQQWEPAFCTNPKLFKFQHVQTSEPEAKNLLTTGSVDAVFAGEPPSTAFSQPVVQAPTAVTGFAISYDIDTTSGQEYTHLRLDARLLAKLLTESYPGNPAIQAGDPALSHNPLDLADDPEFQALNPGVDPEGLDTEPASVLYALSSDSDVTYALTSYINADPEARAWLNGQPDPWGMTVNPNYKGIALPVDTIPQLDTYEPASLYTPQINPCLADNPVPYLPLIAAPVSTLQAISLNLQYDIANSQTSCSDPGATDQKLTALGAEFPGQDFILGLTTISSAERYGLDTASLETQVAPGTPTKFTDSAGRAFASPDDAGLQAAADLMTPDPTTGTWRLPYSTIEDTLADADAYPGTMLVTTDVPTSGLSPTLAKQYSELLDFEAGPGQTPGLGNGDIPSGYLPMTAADGLGAEVAYTRVAAAAVAAQTGKVPPLTPVAATASASGEDTAGPGPGSSPGAGATPSVSASVPAATLPTTAPSAGASIVPAPQVASSSTTPAPTEAVGLTAELTTGVGALVLPVVLGIAAAGAVAAAVLGRRGHFRRST